MPTSGLGQKNIAASRNIASLTPMAPHRNGFQSALRSEAPAERLRQPQDGAPLRAKLATIKSSLQSDFFQEAEDARLTGGTRSLKRRLLGLNLGLRLRKIPTVVPGPMARPKVA